jgi:hypothetical protein
MTRRTKVKGFPSIISKVEFEKLANDSKVFFELFDAWKDSNFTLALTPTVDRIDNKLGYTKDNIQFLSYKDNQSKGSRETKLGKAKLGKRVYLLNEMTREIKSFISGTAARLFIGLPKTRFYSYLEKNKTYNGWRLCRGEV